MTSSSGRATCSASGKLESTTKAFNSSFGAGCEISFRCFFHNLNTNDTSSSGGAFPAEGTGPVVCVCHPSRQTFRNAVSSNSIPNPFGRSCPDETELDLLDQV